MAAGIEPPKRVFAHGWWTNEGQKISKSLGNVIDPYDLVARYGLDQTRYFLLREVPFGNDGDFSHAAMVRRMNSDLANDYGNLCQRVLSMIAKNCDKSVPSAKLRLAQDDQQLLVSVEKLLAQTRDFMNRQSSHQALEAIWRVIGNANRYVDAQAPWTLRKTDQARMATVLYVLAETIRQLAILTQPFMPTSSARILDLLAVENRDFTALGEQRPSSAWAHPCQSRQAFSQDSPSLKAKPPSSAYQLALRLMPKIASSSASSSWPGSCRNISQGLSLSQSVSGAS